jgi:hypothetical protein
MARALIKKQNVSGVENKDKIQNLGLKNVI